jgi:hypothetical protein
MTGKTSDKTCVGETRNRATPPPMTMARLDDDVAEDDRVMTMMATWAMLQ